MLVTLALIAACGDDETTDDAATTTSQTEPSSGTTDEVSDPDEGDGDTDPAGSGCARLDVATIDELFGYDFDDVSQPDDRPGWESCGFAAVGSAAVAVQRLEPGGQLFWEQVVTQEPSLGGAVSIDVGDEGLVLAGYDETVQGSHLTVFAVEGDAYAQVVVTILGAPPSAEPDPAVLTGAREIAELVL